VASGGFQHCGKRGLGLRTTSFGTVPAGYGLSSSGCLGFSQPLWALKGVFESTLAAVTGGPYPLSLSPHSGITLSRGPKNPLYPDIPGPAPQPADYPLSLGLRSPYHHLAACTRPQERGAAVSLPLISAPRVHIWASPITTPPAACRSNSTPFYPGITETDAHTFYPHSPFLGNCPTPLFTLRSSPSLSNTTLSPPLINPPLIPLPHIMGKPPCSNRQVTGTHPDTNKLISRSPQYDGVGVDLRL
jgi:hypothetical protein